MVFHIAEQTNPAIIKALFDVFIYFGMVLVSFVFLNLLLLIAKHSTKPVPKIKQDEFTKIYGYSYDYVFVFKVYVEEEIEHLNELQNKYTMKNVIDRCQNAKIETKCFYSCQRDEIYVKLRAPMSRLLAEADRIDYKLMLNPTNLKSAAKAGSTTKLENGRKVWESIDLVDETKVSVYEPYVFIYAKYDSADHIQSLYTLYPAPLNSEILHPLRCVDRIKLVISILEANVSESPPGCGLEMSNFMAHKVMLAHYPLHNHDILQSIQKEWLVLFALPNSQPILRIKDYFGERIGLYFVFLSYFTTSLMVPAFLGLITFGVRIYYGTRGYYLMPVFAAFITVWCSYFVENWKGLQVTTAMEWGVTGFEDEEQDRVQFEGEESTSPVDGTPFKYFAPRNRLLARATTAATMLLFVLIVLGIVGVVSTVQYHLNDPDNVQNFVYRGKNLTTYFSALILTVLTQILGDVFSHVAKHLNNFENHRTETNYEDNLVSKIFVFMLFNNFGYLTYLSFVKPFLSTTCVDNDCYQEITDTLLILFIVPQLVDWFNEVVKRKFTQNKKFHRETSGLEPNSQVGVVEQEYILNKYHALEATLKDYSELVLLYGYVSLFVAVFPVGPFLALMFTFVKIRIDGWKLCQAFRRPPPMTAEDIGVWQTVMDVMGILAVTYNFGLIFFTGHYLVNVPWDMRWVCFMVAEHIAVVYKVFLAVSIDDVPEDVKMQMDRQKFLVDKVLLNAVDEAGDEFVVVKEVSNIVVTVTDNDWVYPANEDDDDEGGNPKDSLTLMEEGDDTVDDSQL